jgi:hypothetical protein
MATDIPQDEPSGISPVETVEKITTSELFLAVKRDVYIDVPPAHRERRLAIRYADWDRLKANLERLAATLGHDFLSIVYSVLFGFAGSSGLSIMPILKTNDLSPWVAPLYITSTIFALLFGGVCVVLDWKNRGEARGNIQYIVKDMAKIDSMFEQAGTVIKKS